MDLNLRAHDVTMPNSPTAAAEPDKPTNEQGQPRLPALSPREDEVLRQVAWGYTNKEIASFLNLSVKTIEAHKANGMRKLACKRRADVVRHAVQKQWFDLDIAAIPESPRSTKSEPQQGVAGQLR